MAVLPVPKAFRLVRGASFDYSFQYLNGIPGAATAVDLTGYTATWTLHTPNSNTTYSTGAQSGDSGVFFGGTSHDLTTGIIDLVISATDTAAFDWTSVSYNLSLTSPTNTITNLLTGAVAVVNSLP